MKVILSRKGFDSGTGGFPSPILPDGRLVSLPIPDDSSITYYRNLELYKGYSYLNLLQSLCSDSRGTKKRSINEDMKCHLDPDLSKSVIERKEGWKGAFGQISTAQRHLENQGISRGDIFLFFGWFRKTINVNGKITFDKKDKQGRHVIFGYLQIEDILNLYNDMPVPDWLSYHPHNDISRRTQKSNTIYIARENTSWDKKTPGYGVFKYDESLVLTKEGCNRSIWQLPSFFKNVNISYHDDMNWKNDYFQSVCRGQEFVVEANNEVISWTKMLIALNAGAR